MTYFCAWPLYPINVKQETAILKWFSNINLWIYFFLHKIKDWALDYFIYFWRLECPIVSLLHTITISNTTGVIFLSGYLTTLSFLAVPSPSTQCQTTSRSCTFGAAYITSSVCVSSSRFSYPTIQPSHHTLGSRKNCKYSSPYKSGLNFPKGESSC